jgi:D-alanyl-D-alanine carboxypeptidase/D-alanyl-D-alanine-endopeptidase (penicillin-binding protein 4)
LGRPRWPMCWLDAADRRGAGGAGARPGAAACQRGQGRDLALRAGSKLGAGYRFATRVLVTGPVQGGDRAGRHRAGGRGRPDLADRPAGRSGGAAGEGRAEGRDGAVPVLGRRAAPAGARSAADQPAHVGYNAAVSGLNLNFNRAYFEWKTGGRRLAHLGRCAGRTLPARRRHGAGRRGSSADAPLFTYALRGGWRNGRWRRPRWARGAAAGCRCATPGPMWPRCSGRWPGRRGSRWRLGERVGSVPPGEEIGRVESEPLPEVLRDMLRFSTNLTAECVGLTASGQGSLEASGKAHVRLGAGGVRGEFRHARPFRAGRAVAGDGGGDGEDAGAGRAREARAEGRSCATSG